MSRSALIVGAGIGGLTAALSLHRIGLDVDVYEAVPEIRALGVGINLLPHAVRELDALGLLPVLEPQSIAPTRLAYFTKRGVRIWDEPRGRAAGYAWPQLSIHRGVLHRALLDAVHERVGREHVHLGHHFVACDERPGDEHVVAHFSSRRDGPPDRTSTGSVLVAADGIHSVMRSLRHPDEGPPKWNGSLLWRGVTEAPPLLGGRTMIWAGHPDQKFVGYPIVDLPNGNQMFNFIAEYRTVGVQLMERENWNQPGCLSDFIGRFESWRFPWLDVPGLIRSAPGTFRFPMVDRDPLGRWSYGRTTLLGDAAHPMYPIGSNGASQAILDAQVLAGCLASYLDDPVEALTRYDEVRRTASAAVVLANRQLGPEVPMKLVEDRDPEGLHPISQVISHGEILRVTEDYRSTAGFSLALLADGRSLAERTY